MGGTFDMTSRSDLGASTSFFGAVGRFWVRGRVSARCWVLRDRMRFAPSGVGAFGYSGPFVVSPVGEMVRGTARTLRTTQWTRASCNSLRVVAQDDLKDH